MGEDFVEYFREKTKYVIPFFKIWFRLFDCV